MAFIADIEDNLLETLNDELKIPVIAEFEDGPEPKGDYASLRYITSDQLDRSSSYFNKTESGFTECIRQNFLIRFNLKFFGDSCHENAFISQAILKTNTIQEHLFGISNLSYIESTAMQNIPELRDTGYIQRAIFDVKFLSGFEYTKNIDWFNTVSYEGKYVTPDGSLVLTENHTISPNNP